MATGLSGKNGPVLRMRYMVIFREIWELSNRGCDFFLKRNPANRVGICKKGSCECGTGLLVLIVQ